MKRRPGGLTAICVIALVVGILSVLTGLSQFASLLFGQKLQAAIMRVQPGNNPELQKTRQEIQVKTEFIARKYAPYQWLSAATQSILAWMMIVGAALTLCLKTAGRKLLLIAFAASVVFEPAKAVLTGAAMRETAPVMMQSMQQAAKSSALPGSPQADDVNQMMGGLSQLIVVMQWVMLIGLMLLWCVFYLVGVWYLTKPAVKALFTPDVRSDPDGPGEPQLR